MKHKTKIGWTHADGFIGETLNVVTGCTRISPGCDHCYAQRMLGRNLAWHTGRGLVCHPERIKKVNWRKPRCVFMCSMGDLFHEDVPTPFIDKCLAAIDGARRHRFLLLTKRERRMREVVKAYCDFVGHVPPNVGMGVSAENQEMADQRIPVLLRTPAAMRFVSVEPMLTPVDLKRHLVPCSICEHQEKPLFPKCRVKCVTHNEVPQLSWVICGGETGPGARPMHWKWAYAIRDQCLDLKVPFYFKQMAQGDAMLKSMMVRQFPVWGEEEDA